MGPNAETEKHSRKPGRVTVIPGIILVLLCLQGMSHEIFGRDNTEAHLRLSVKDDAGQPIAFRVQVFEGNIQVALQWERGKAELRVPPGKSIILIRHGFDYDAVRIDTLIRPGSVIVKTVTLRKRYDLKKLSWYCGESHMHGQHGTADQPQTFEDASRLAEADGLNYIQVAQWWRPDFSWTSVDTLQQMALKATTDLVDVNWNMESPKCYMEKDDGGKSGNLHCYGHGITLGLKERPFDKSFWFTGPNFRIIQEIHRQHAVVMLAHPVRFWFNSGNFVSNMASEIAFDYITGNGYDGIDIFNDGEPSFFGHERVWWNLLNMGYKVSGTANTDGSIIDGQAGRFRTYTRIKGDFSWDKIAEGIRYGACIASSGPMVLFQVDGKDPGSEFKADGVEHQASIRVWSSPLPGETLVSVQIIRNGEIVQAWDLHKKQLRQWTSDFKLSDKDFSWYAIRVTSTCRDPELLNFWTQPADIYEEAVASPVYFIPEGFHRPEPAGASVRLKITDEAGNPLDAKVTIIDSGNNIGERTVPANDSSRLRLPATASLVIKALGFEETRKDIYMDSPVFPYCRDFTGFYSPQAFNELREILGKLSFDVRLKKVN